MTNFKVWLIFFQFIDDKTTEEFKEFTDKYYFTAANYYTIIQYWFYIVCNYSIFSIM